MSPAYLCLDIYCALRSTVCSKIVFLKKSSEMLVPNTAGYTRVKDSRSQPGVARTFQQFLYISGQAWRSKVAPRSDHDIPQLYHVRNIRSMIVDWTSSSWLLQIQRSESCSLRRQGWKYYKTIHLICRRVASNEAFIFSKYIKHPQHQHRDRHYHRE